MYEVFIEIEGGIKRFTVDSVEAAKREIERYEGADNFHHATVTNTETGEKVLDTWW